MILFWENKANRYISLRITSRLHWLSGRRVKHLTHRKIVLVIVEGPSDETALGAVLRNIKRIRERNKQKRENIKKNDRSDITRLK